MIVGIQRIYHLQGLRVYPSFAPLVSEGFLCVSGGKKSGIIGKSTLVRGVNANGRARREVVEGEGPGVLCRGATACESAVALELRVIFGSGINRRTDSLPVKGGIVLSSGAGVKTWFR